mmetsp:Transcript_29758/g.48452  ORF Transcript_29758/g.48452 Transcript_29758/m.48452 type:complete len:227 (+) Transcript_29758:166-846(+)
MRKKHQQYNNINNVAVVSFQHKIRHRSYAVLHLVRLVHSMHSTPCVRPPISVRNQFACLLFFIFIVMQICMQLHIRAMLVKPIVLRLFDVRINPFGVHLRARGMIHHVHQANDLLVRCYDMLDRILRTSVGAIGLQYETTFEFRRQQFVIISIQLIQITTTQCVGFRRRITRTQLATSRMKRRMRSFIVKRGYGYQKLKSRVNGRFHQTGKIIIIINVFHHHVTAH